MIQPRTSKAESRHLRFRRSDSFGIHASLQLPPSLADPYDAEALAGLFGRKNKKRTQQIERIVESLKGLGQLGNPSTSTMRDRPTPQIFQECPETGCNIFHRDEIAFRRTHHQIVFGQIPLPGFLSGNVFKLRTGR